MAQQIEIRNPTKAELEALQALGVGTPPTDGRRLQSIKLDRDKAGKNVIRYNGEVEGKTFAFYCPKSLLSKRPAKHLTILVHESDD